MKNIWTSRRTEAGATAVEYALILAGVALVIGAAVATFGGAVASLYDLRF